MKNSAKDVLDITASAVRNFKQQPDRGSVILAQARQAINQKILEIEKQPEPDRRNYEQLCNKARGGIGLAEDFALQRSYNPIIESALRPVEQFAEIV